MSDIMLALKRCAAVYDGATAFSDETTSLTRAGLAARVSGFAEELRPLPQTIGLLGDNSVEWAIAQLAGWLAGKIMVPLPAFFSGPQLGHIVSDTGITHAIATRGARDIAAKLGIAAVPLSLARSQSFPEVVPGGGQIIYTSGSTGRPKGVRLGLAQIDASALRLAQATNATRWDTYLSVLPLPLLLETICAICVPLLAGAYSHFDGAVAAAVARGDTTGIAAAFGRHRPTTSVLVPQVLAAWVGAVEASGARAPEGLRFVAVGGAPIGAELAEKAWSLGIPVYEGYGLSECSSVVAVNRAGQRKAGTVGQALPGLSVQIEDGEILVDGPTIMEGYLHGPPAARPWRTGDLGALDSAGYLTVYGRKDNLIVTSYGRNVSPEWIEAMLLADPRFAACAVLGHGAPHLSALIVPSRTGARWLAEAPSAHVLMAMALACRDAPAYAVPRDFIVVGAEEASRRNLLTANGRFRRAGLASAYAEIRAATAAIGREILAEKEITA
jgi:long-subunit acyl-CoA synthetase (AMP-forming)